MSPSSTQTKIITVSFTVVVYRSDVEHLASTLDALAAALEHARKTYPGLQLTGFLVENDPAQTTLKPLATKIERWRQHFQGFTVITATENRGYGGGQNQVLAKLNSDYHLILNPDVCVAPTFFTAWLEHVQQHPQALAWAPYAVCTDDNPLYLCKRYPTVMDLFLRGFTPGFVRCYFHRRLNAYQMVDVYEADVVQAVPIISGCCMLVKTSAFKQLQGFDENYFLYFEDFDLSLRLGQQGEVLFNPTMKITHAGGFSARKGWWHIVQFMCSAKRFFSQYGWRWW